MFKRGDRVLLQHALGTIGTVRRVSTNGRGERILDVCIERGNRRCAVRTCVPASAAEPTSAATIAVERRPKV